MSNTNPPSNRNSNQSNHSNINEIQNQSTLEEINEYKKANNQLEELLEKKQEEYDILLKFYEDLKGINEMNQKELSSLNDKLLISYDNIKETEEKYEKEKEELEEKLIQQKKAYQEQILKLSIYDPEIIKKKVESELNIKFKKTLDQKDAQIAELQENIIEAQKKYDLLFNEYQVYKSDALKELNTNKQIHEAEVEELMQKLEIHKNKEIGNTINIENETFIGLNKQVQEHKQKAESLNNEILILRKEKENLIAEKNELKINNIKNIDADKFKLKSLESENKRMECNINTLKSELDNIKKNLENQKNENTKITQQNIELINNLHEQEKNYNRYKSEVLVLRKHINNKHIEDEKKVENEHKEHKLYLFKQREAEESYQKYINNLEADLREEKVKYSHLLQNTKDELNDAKRELEYEKEEAINLKNRFDIIRDSLAKLQKDYDSLQISFQCKSEEVDDYKNKIKDLTIQCQKAKNYNFNEYFSIDEIKKKYQFYKKECIKANERYKVIFSLLTEQQQNQVNDLIKHNTNI